MKSKTRRDIDGLAVLSLALAVNTVRLGWWCATLVPRIAVTMLNRAAVAHVRGR